MLLLSQIDLYYFEWRWTFLKLVTHKSKRSRKILVILFVSLVMFVVLNEWPKTIVIGVSTTFHLFGLFLARRIELAKWIFVLAASNSMVNQNNWAVIIYPNSFCSPLKPNCFFFFPCEQKFFIRLVYSLCIQYTEMAKEPGRTNLLLLV